MRIFIFSSCELISEWKCFLVVAFFSCQLVNTLRQLKGAGRLTGEEIEQMWSFFNRLIPSTLEASPFRRLSLIALQSQIYNFRRFFSVGGAF